MSSWVLWVLVACAFGIGVLLTRRLSLAAIVIAAALAGGVARAGGGVTSVVVFLVAALAAIVLLRPVVRRTHRRPPEEEIAFDTHGLVGKHAVVLERIENREGLGFVKIDGEVWTARALDRDHVIERGVAVEVVDMKGATALVAEQA
jgi:membrane protein implicated in regulation of membrane protease activity